MAKPAAAPMAMGKPREDAPFFWPGVVPLGEADAPEADFEPDAAWEVLPVEGTAMLSAPVAMGMVGVTPPWEWDRESPAESVAEDPVELVEEAVEEEEGGADTLAMWPLDEQSPWKATRAVCASPWGQVDWRQATTLDPLASQRQEKSCKPPWHIAVLETEATQAKRQALKIKC